MCHLTNLNPPMITKEVCQILLYMAVKNVEFRFNISIYRPMDLYGQPLGPVLVNIFVGYFESNLFKDVERPLISNMLIKSSLHPSLKFMIENEVKGSLPFLDDFLQRTSTSKCRSIYILQKTNICESIYPLVVFVQPHKKLVCFHV